ncbi:MAG: outer membrane lipoprotein-sorting protein [Zetaproteobacteria bacterium]|nr:outer membrane lipoprotein-sorting protein [Zetaproteobacteria bacterium]
MKALFLTLSLTLLLEFSQGVSAFESKTAKPSNNGLEIMQSAEAHNQGWHDSQGNLTMTLINRHGETRIRKIHSMAREATVTDHASEGEQRLMVFLYPPEIRGTSMLSYSHKDRDDEQWLYIPALKKVRRIAARNRNNAFMGSEFSYEDIVGETIEKYHYQWLRDESYQDQPCFVIEAEAIDPKASGYSKRILWIDQIKFRTLKIEYFDQKEQPLKILTFNHYQCYLSHFWRAELMEMHNLQNDNRTLLQWSELELYTGLNHNDFSQRALKQE